MAEQGERKEDGTKKLEFKLAVMGSGAVGKSALTIRMVDDTQFIEGYDPTIEDSFRTQTVIDREAAILDILDTAGQSEFESLTDSWIRDGEGFILVFAINNKVSFNKISLLREKILRSKDSRTVPMVLVGNKCDLVQDRIVSEKEANALAKEFGCRYLETSAKEDINCKEPFHHIVRIIRHKFVSGQVDEEPESPTRPTRRRGLRSLCVIL
eukprot:jgi/Bigna1/41164/e_gw1.50.74.1